jgi:cbb3-type cytochrome oxidase subunit 3
MKLSDVMSAAGLSTYAIVALVLFMGTWIAVAIWTFAPARGARYAADARLPLTDDGSAPRTEE